MRKHLSVFGLWARCSLYKILAVLAVMSVAEYMLFYIIMSKESAIYEAIGTFSRPENLVDRSGVFLCFAVAFLVITALITVYGCQFSSKTGYTLRRLRINERYVFLYQSLYNLLVYALLWSIQTVLCIFMLKFYISQAPAELVAEQSVFMAFYRSARLHALMPLSDGITWARNILLLVLLSVCSAEFPYLQRRGKKSATVIALALYTVALWKQDISPVGCLVSTVFVAIVAISAVVYHLFVKEESENETEETEY